ncbi:MAG: hypothetical protein ABJE95_23040 [Byssovorax sp.]
MSDAAPYEKTRRPSTAETPIDLFVLRPAGRVLADLAQSTPLRSRWVTALSAFIGVAGASLLRFTTRTNVLVGAALLLLHLVLGNAAVQLARARGTASRRGRILAGICDYLVGLVTAIAMALHLSAEGSAGGVVLALLGMGSVAMQVTLFDHFENRYLACSGGESPEESDLAESRAAVKGLVDAGDGGAEVLLHRAHTVFLSLQALLGGPTRPTPRSAEKARDYAERLAPIARAWAWLGSSTHVLLVVIFAVVGALPAYLWLRLFGGNLLMVALWVEQQRREREVLAAQA